MFHNKRSYFSEKKTKWTAKINQLLKFIKIKGFIEKHWTQNCQDITKIDKVKQIEKKKISKGTIKIKSLKNMKISFNFVKMNRYIIRYSAST